MLKKIKTTKETKEIKSIGDYKKLIFERKLDRRKKKKSNISNLEKDGFHGSKKRKREIQGFKRKKMNKIRNIL